MTLITSLQSLYCKAVGIVLGWMKSILEDGVKRLISPQSQYCKAVDIVLG
jgi:hypothetical protein